MDVFKRIVFLRRELYEIRMLQGLVSCKPLVRIKSQQVFQKVKAFWASFWEELLKGLLRSIVYG